MYCKLGVSRSSFYTGLTLAMRVTQSVPECSKSFDDGSANTKCLLEYLLRVLRRSKVQMFCRLLVEVTDVGALVVLRVGVF